LLCENKGEVELQLLLSKQGVSFVLLFDCNDVIKNLAFGSIIIRYELMQKHYK